VKVHLLKQGVLGLYNCMKICKSPFQSCPIKYSQRFVPTCFHCCMYVAVRWHFNSFFYYHMTSVSAHMQVQHAFYCLLFHNFLLNCVRKRWPIWLVKWEHMCTSSRSRLLKRIVLPAQSENMWFDTV